MKFNKVVCCGGTFDHFHKGHRKFLRTALLYGKKVIIGVTSDKYIKNSKFPAKQDLAPRDKILASRRSGQNSKLIEPFERRRRAVLGFLEKEKVLGRAEIVKIDDLFGPTLAKDLEIDAIVVSENTKKGAGIINQKRKELGLSPLKVFVASSVKAEDGKLISSERIRMGEINREGRLFIKPVWLKNKLCLTQPLRKILEKPQGVLIKNIADFQVTDSGFIATVGDVTTKMFKQSLLTEDIAVVDFKVNRVEKFKSIKDLGFLGNETVLNVNNPAGFLTPASFNKVLQAVSFLRGNKKSIIIRVAGEEDLLVLPLVLALPLNSTIFYGQRGQGIVKVEVSEEQKERVFNLVKRFKALS